MLFRSTSIDKGYTVTVVTDENGLALVKLPLGQYTIAETKAPEGYAIIEEVKTIDVTGEVTEATVFVFENKKIIQEPKPTPQPQPAPKPTPQPGPKPSQEQSNISKKPSNNNISELPKTGDVSIMGFVGALLLSVGGLLINDRK